MNLHFKTFYSTLIFLLLFLSSNFASSDEKNDSSQESNDKEVRRMFIYHFINYIEWPNEAGKNNFKIAVLNDNKMYDVLHKQMNGAIRRGKKIVVEKVDENHSLEGYSVVYIARNSSKLLEDIKEKTSDQNLLLVTDRNGLADKGSGINFKEEGSKLKFEINLNEIKNRGLKVANQLKKVAILI